MRERVSRSKKKEGVGAAMRPLCANSASLGNSAFPAEPSQRDLYGNIVSYAYNAGGLLTSVADASGETTYYDYAGNNLTQIRTVCQSNGSPVTSTRVRYAYDASNRLSSVTVDLSPSDNSIADGKTYVTSYTYDDTSKRVASITESDGTSLAFTYVQIGAAIASPLWRRKSARTTRTEQGQRPRRSGASQRDAARAGPLLGDDKHVDGVSFWNMRNAI